MSLGDLSQAVGGCEIEVIGIGTARRNARGIGSEDEARSALEFDDK